MIGSHKIEVCWKLHPQLKPEHMKRKDERYRYRERSRSREGGEGSKRGREKGPHPNRNSVRRITSGDREETDRDSDDSHDTLDQIKESEKEAKRYKELADRAEEVARIKKKSLKQRRLKRTSKTSRSRSPEGNSGTWTGQRSSKIFSTNEMEIQIHELEKMAKEKWETKDPQKKVRRVKKSSKVNKGKADRERDW